MEEEIAKASSRAGAAQKAMHELYSSYEAALRKTGKPVDNLNFESFKKSLIKKARELKERHGVKKLQYKIVVKDGKVVVKASGK